MSEAKEDNLNRLVQKLDGLRIGRMEINKCTACSDVWLTVCDAEAVENHKEFFEDDQLSFWPAELLAFCHEVVLIAHETDNMGLQGWTTASDKFEPKESGLDRQSFPCCACKHQGKTDADEPCRSCGHNLIAVIDSANIALSNSKQESKGGAV